MALASLFDPNTRLLPFIGWLSAFLNLVFSLIVVLAGIHPDKLQNAFILSFNTSSLGLAAYHDPSSPIYDSLKNLVPTNLTSTPSITRYIGVKDWYSLHYLSVCSGFFALSEDNTSLLTSKKINTTCQSTIWLSCNTCLRGILRDTLVGTVEKLAGEAPGVCLQTYIWVWPWFTGIAFCGTIILFLPMGFERKSRWTWFGVALALFSLTSFIATAGVLTNIVTKSHHKGEGTYSISFIALTWTSVACMLLALISCLLEGSEVLREIKEVRYDSYYPGAEVSID